MARAGILLLFFIVTQLTAPAALGQSPSPPTQAETGPGGSDYRYAAVTGAHFGTAPTGYWLFEPAEDVAEPLPLVVFLHGFTAVDPETYAGWIEHLARRGAVVVFPDYQTARPLEISALEFTGNALTGLQAALEELDIGRHAPVDLERVAVVGHSMGGVLTLNLAALAPALGLPEIDAIMPVTPGGCLECNGPELDGFGIPYRDLTTIPAETRLVMVVGEDDDFVGDGAARKAWGMTGQISDERRDYVVLRTDRHGDPPLIADHGAPTGGPFWTVDALDWRGLWKWFDSLMLCAFEGVGCEEGLNSGALQLDMGEWTDGTPVLEPLVTDGP